MIGKEAAKMLMLFNTNDIGEGELNTWYSGIEKDMQEALYMAIEALSNNTIIEKQNDVIEVVRCKDCRHAYECHKSVQYTRNEPTTITMGYVPIEFCSHGERREL